MSPPFPYFTPLPSDSQLDLPTMEGRRGEPSKGFISKEKLRKGFAGEEERDEEEGLASRKLGGEEEKKRRLSSPAPGGATAVCGIVGSIGPGSGVGSGSHAFCQAEKCAADITDAKRYHRRHKVCETHSKAAVVIVAGLRQRFCQQCSRFHELTEFDESKRSCRRRLAGHNERRRKSSSESQGDASSSCGQADQSGRTQVALPGTPTYKHFQIR